MFPTSLRPPLKVFGYYQFSEDIHKNIVGQRIKACVFNGKK